MTVSTPSILIVPASGRISPERMPIRVDLPAPFSPSRQCTSPRWRERSTRSLASTPGNAFVIPESSTNAVPVSLRAFTVLGSVCSKKRTACGRSETRRRRLRVIRCLLDQLLDGLGLVRDRDRDLPGHDLTLGLGELGPEPGRDVLRVQERDSAVLEAEVVPVRAVAAAVDVAERRLERAGEVPEHRREQNVVLVDWRHVADIADVPDLVPDLRGLDRLQVAERRVVAHREDHVGTLRD